MARAFGQWFGYHLYFANFSIGTVFFQSHSCTKMPKFWAVFTVIQFIGTRFMYVFTLEFSIFCQ